MTRSPIELSWTAKKATRLPENLGDRDNLFSSILLLFGFIVPISRFDYEFNLNVGRHIKVQSKGHNIQPYLFLQESNPVVRITAFSTSLEKKHRVDKDICFVIIPDISTSYQFYSEVGTKTFFHLVKVSRTKGYSRGQYIPYIIATTVDIFITR